MAPSSPEFTSCKGFGINEENAKTLESTQIGSNLAETYEVGAYNTLLIYGSNLSQVKESEFSADREGVSLENLAVREDYVKIEVSIPDDFDGSVQIKYQNETICICND